MIPMIWDMPIDPASASHHGGTPDDDLAPSASRTERRLEDVARRMAPSLSAAALGLAVTQSSDTSAVAGLIAAGAVGLGAAAIEFFGRTRRRRHLEIAETLAADVWDELRSARPSGAAS